MVEAIQVLRTYCPFWQRTVYELWNGSQPLIPANNYLRSNLALSDSTLENKAYLLTHFFRFLMEFLSNVVYGESSGGDSLSLLL